jgi:uncharacterized delta-60 repeat protein
MPARAVGGDLDTSFGDGGFTVTNIRGEDHATGVAVQSDGKIVVVGSQGAGSSFVVIRLTATGTLDPTFANDGIAPAPFHRGSSATGVAVTPAGRIVVVGSVGGASRSIAVAVFLSSGVLDPSFSKDGVATAKLGRTDSLGWAVAVQSDGKIVVAGTSAGRRGALVRFTSEGSLDPTFSGDGKVTLSFGEDFTQLTGVATHPAGGIVAVGYSHMNSDASFASFAIARLTASGALDPTFSGDGMRRLSFGSSGNDYANDVAIQQDGEIVVAGSAGTSAAYGFGLARLHATGELDESFSENGRLVTSFDVPFAYAFGVVLEPDGDIVAAGAKELPASREVCGGRAVVVRYLPDGALDTSFSGDGIASPTYPGSISESPNDVALQANGMVVFAGTWQMPGYDIGVGRLEG